MNESIAYYRRRIDEELAAAMDARGPGAAQIHRDMAQLYQDMLDSQIGGISDTENMPRPVGGLIVDTCLLS